MMPVYFCDDPVTLQEMSIAKLTWNMILLNESPVFIHRKSTEPPERFHYDSCVAFFYDTFYLRLFDVHPLCKPMFQGGLKSRGKFLVKMIGLAVSILDEPAKFEETLIKLGDAHNKRGVKAIEYGIIGEVLFWSLDHVLGAEVHDSHTSHAWVKIFSKMLAVIVPVALAYELTNGEAQIDRLRKIQEEPKDRDVASVNTVMSISLHPI